MDYRISQTLPPGLLLVCCLSAIRDKQRDKLLPLVYKLSFIISNEKSTRMKYFLSSLIFTIIAISDAATVCKAQDEKYVKENERDLSTITKVYAKYALDTKPTIAADTDLIGIWKMNEDEDSHNYFVLERYDNNTYVFTYMNHEGSNRTWENDGAFISKIGNTEFINAGYYNWETQTKGYFFLKVIERDSRGFNMTLALVADTTLKDISDQSAVRERVAKNLNNNDYYKKPVHFHKILPLMYCK
jgi:hypothetical protein